jgi:hypothetical protein
VAMLLTTEVESQKTVTEERRDFRMVRCMPEQRTFLVKTYQLKKAYNGYLPKFRRHYPEVMRQ